MSANLIECRRILGVDENAGMKEIRKAFHARAGLFHPDVRRNNPNAETEFKRITFAYQALKREVLKAAKKEKKTSSAKQMSAESGKPPATGRTGPAAATAIPCPPLDMDELVHRLRFSQNRYVRIHAIRVIAGQGGDKTSLWWIIGALKDRDAEVRRAAVRALGDMKSVVAVVPLMELKRISDPFLCDEIDVSIERIQRKKTPEAPGRKQSVS